MLSLRQLLIEGKRYLKDHNADGVLNPALDAELLLMHMIGYERIALVTRDGREITDAEQTQYRALLKQRSEGMPIQYLTGKAEFMSLDFTVNEHVLIPRPDTEILVERLIAHVKPRDFLEIVEIGTGSGCIAVSVAHYCPDSHITAADISPEALAAARENARIHGVEHRIDFVQSDLFAAIPEGLKNHTDVIVSNPPYIRTDDIARLGRNVKDYEPLLALDGKSDGLYFYRKITEASAAFLKNGGLLIFEIGFDQKEDVSRIMARHGYRDICCLKDLSGHDRVVFGYQIGSVRND